MRTQNTALVWQTPVVVTAYAPTPDVKPVRSRADQERTDGISAYRGVVVATAIPTVLALITGVIVGLTTITSR